MQLSAKFIIKIGSLALGSIALYAIGRTLEAAVALAAATVLSVVLLYAATDREYPGRPVDEPGNQDPISDLHPPLDSWLFLEKQRLASAPEEASKDIASTNVTDPDGLLPAPALPPAQQDIQNAMTAGRGPSR
jgi:hypothetical protein